ncbi:MAG TPA: hypothetical protein VFG86_27170 [Chloroflexota bacterium]|nr:hypothetical protein [Chloroflexota bacterium]
MGHGRVGALGLLAFHGLPLVLELIQGFVLQAFPAANDPRLEGREPGQEFLIGAAEGGLGLDA